MLMIFKDLTQVAKIKPQSLFRESPSHTNSTAVRANDSNTKLNGYGTHSTECRNGNGLGTQTEMVYNAEINARAQAPIEQR